MLNGADKARQKRWAGVNDNSPSIDRPIRTHDEVAKALGIGGSTYLRAGIVIQDTEDETLPADLRAAATFGINRRKSNVNRIRFEVRGILPLPPHTR